MSRLRSLLVALSWSLSVAGAGAQTNSASWFPVPADAVYLTGDSWSAGGAIYRLYGVQACLRGTSFTNAYGLKRDCGEASLAMLVALTRDLQPQCYDAAEAPQTHTVFVFCVATRLAGAGAGSRIDLGTALIATGFAFAAVNPDGQAVHTPYWVAEQVAEQSKAGLWAFADLPDPNTLILQALHRAPSSAVSTPTTPEIPKQP